MIKFIKEHIGEIAFSLIVIICTCFFVHIITLAPSFIPRSNRSISKVSSTR